MIQRQDISRVLENYDTNNITVGVLGGHSALDVCHGAKQYGFRTVVVCQKGREKTYERYYRSRDGKGIIDEVIVLDAFSDITKPEIQEQLRKLNTIFVHSRYFWVYVNFAEIEQQFSVPIFGTRGMVKLEERDQPTNQYHLLTKAGIRIPKIFSNPQDIDRLVIVKATEAARGYERAFFFVKAPQEFEEKSQELIEKGVITKEALDKAVIEEFVCGAPINFNYFYSPLTGEVELLGTDTRRQTNLDGFLRLPAPIQKDILSYQQVKMIETGHVAVTAKESLLEKAFSLGEQFVETCKQEHPPGIIGPFALQGAVTAEEGKEDIVIFDASLRVPGSPGTFSTPYSGYLHGKSISCGERIGMELRDAVKRGQLGKVCT